MRLLRSAVLKVCLLALLAGTACGGGGSGGSDAGGAAVGASSSSAARCAVPRTGVDPWTGAPYPDVQGSVADEKRWLRAWIDELYLWYREVPDPNPAAFSTATSYFDALKTRAVMASGQPKDRFHFTYPTDVWNALSRSGVELGYGVEWALLNPYPPRRVVAVFVEPSSPGALAGIVRGSEVLAVDGVDFVWSNDVDTLNDGLFPQTRSTHSLTISGVTGSRTVVLTSGDVQHTPVPVVSTISTPTGTVGYLLFNDHMATAEAQLASAIAQLAGVKDLVLDLRYNGGGYLAVAAELAYMIAGPSLTAGKTFERPIFNDKITSTDPVTGEPIVPTPFISTGQGFSLAPGTPLPTLGLGRVYVLTGSGTCSASESVINGLRGAGVQVLQIGETTCGKPYGFYPADNCGTTYFAIQIQGVNALGFGNYGDGFVPGGTGAAGVPGCAVADDYAHALGAPAEARLGAALALRANGVCPWTSALAPAPRAAPARDGTLVKAPWRENRIWTQ